MNTCSKCLCAKSIDEFPIRSGKRMTKCKQCYKEYNARYFQKSKVEPRKMTRKEALTRLPKKPKDREWYIDNASWSIEREDFWHINFDNVSLCPMDWLTVEYWENRQKEYEQRAKESIYGEYIRKEEQIY